MNYTSFEASRISKTFNRRNIFSDVSFRLENRSSIAITGRNGSGKSTLLKILIGVLTPSKGEVLAEIENKQIELKNLFRYIGFVSPYLQMYDEFTAWENLEFIRKVRGAKITDAELINLLERVNLTQATHQLVRTFSSGMKQRLKYAFALLHNPQILILDEPTANLDQEGKSTVQSIVNEQKERGLLIVATNEPDEVSWCEQTLNLNDFRKQNISVKP